MERERYLGVGKIRYSEIESVESVKGMVVDGDRIETKEVDDWTKWPTLAIGDKVGGEIATCEEGGSFWGRKVRAGQNSEIESLVAIRGGGKG